LLAKDPHPRPLSQRGREEKKSKPLSKGSRERKRKAPLQRERGAIKKASFRKGVGRKKKPFSRAGERFYP